MNKITVIPILQGDQKFDWNKEEYHPGKETLAYGRPVEITDDEINQYIAQHMFSVDETDAALSVWYYIKQRISNQ